MFTHILKISNLNTKNIEIISQNQGNLVSLPLVCSPETKSSKITFLNLQESLPDCAPQNEMIFNNNFNEAFWKTHSKSLNQISIKNFLELIKS